ncbi:hypothetical protein A5756_11785 [Mycobacterium sp. 852002-53434_SCH5985345]|uniref:hypothetical protein n=1 Tax=unclassified Mycobacterium TaxID=2642494 RepID=UPI0007FFFC88|nr:MULTISPECIES: hypothetical protein [unclassified Mycobacterium]OBF55959.1 hypothetical protein A5756_11785 [Mycobacterium sp. 852002-53434_SCH5985345]OBF76196.1 hypothetical protein A5750_09110 [Mycobacterium sp. 852002-51613_SCH5001154]OBF98803.1 hypothetical protein A5773_08835 [Mycobacterium sp. 852014-52450_SCH5900713]
MADDDTPSSPGTQAWKPDFSDSDEDTGTQSWVPDFSDDSEDAGEQPAAAKDEPERAEPAASEQGADAESAVAPVQPVTVPGRYLYLKWWKLLLTILGVWCVAAVVGFGLFYWWYHSTDQTAALFAVLVYVVACAVGGVLLAMVEGRPLVSALSLAVMSGPFASLAAAAPLHGYYHCARVGHCLLGLIPY